MKKSNKLTTQTQNLIIVINILKKKLKIKRPSVVVHVHGGGYFIGHADDKTQDSYCRRLAKETSSLVLSLEYRLAPEHPYPASRVETEELVRWLRSSSSSEPARCRSDLRTCAQTLDGIPWSYHMDGTDRHPRGIAKVDW